MSQPILPDELLIKILSCCSPNTVASSRVASKKLLGLVNYNYLWRPQVDEFSVELRQYEDRTAPLGRIQFKKTQKIKKRLVVTVKKNNRSNAMVEECDEGPSNSDTKKIGEAMRSVKLSERLSFDGVIADNAFFKMLTSKWNDMSSVKKLWFTLARMRLTEEQMIQVLSKTSVTTFALEFCHHDRETLTDKVIAAMPKLQDLRVQVRSPLIFYSLTDKTLKVWINNTPQNVFLDKVTTGFTLQGVKEAVQALKTSMIDWELGTILQTEDTAVEILRLTYTPGININITDAYKSKRYRVSTPTMKIVFNLADA